MEKTGMYYHNKIEKFRLDVSNCLTRDATPSSILEFEASYKDLESIILRWFLSIALCIPTAQDFCVISARKLARACTQRKKFPSS